MSELVARSVAEYTSIFGAASLLTFGRITPNAGQSVHITQVWTVAGVQVCARFQGSESRAWQETSVGGLALLVHSHVCC